MKKQAPLLVIAGFLYLWLMVGFIAGTLTLLGPVRWLTTRFRAAGWPGESAAVIAIILLFVATSLLITRWLLRRTLRARHRGVRLAIPVAATLAALSTGWAWMNPGTIIGSGAPATEEVVLDDGAAFVFGPYPDGQRLEALKAAGFTGVISLLHPAVVPFEPKLLREERAAVRRAGLRFIHTPMLPWVGDNEVSLERVRRLARAGEGRYYVHCYLGRDRANAVRRVVESEGLAAAGTEGLAEARSLAEREEPFERGSPEELASDIWLIPFPNDHELFGYVLFSSTQHLVSLLDTADVRQREWHEHVSRLLVEYSVPYTSAPLAPGEVARARALAAEVLSLPRPVVVLAPYTAPHTGAAVAETFRKAFRAALSSAARPRARPRPRFSERQAHSSPGEGSQTHGVARAAEPQ